MVKWEQPTLRPHCPPQTLFMKAMHVGILRCNYVLVRMRGCDHPRGSGLCFYCPTHKLVCYYNGDRAFALVCARSELTP